MTMIADDTLAVVVKRTRETLRPQARESVELPLRPPLPHRANAGAGPEVGVPVAVLVNV